MPGLGYVYKDDPRDHAFRAVRPASPAGAAPVLRVRPWKAAASTDQGNTGTCVGHSVRHWMSAAPIMDDPREAPSGFDLYRRIILLDEWPENDREANLPDHRLDFGSSVRAGCKFLQRAGMIREYVRAFSAMEVSVAVKTLTTVMLGTDWANSMFDPDGEGVVRFDPRSGIAGGHAYLCHWWDAARGLFLCQNSWGRWGVDHPVQRALKGTGGFFYLPGEDLEHLLARDAEAWTAVELRRR